jgi:AraC family transcriptional regulator
MWLTDDVHAPRFRIDWHTHPHPGCTFTVRGGYRERNAAAEFACEPGMWMLKPAEARHINQYGAEATRSLHLMFLAGERPELDRGIGRNLGVGLLQHGSAPRLGRRLVRELSLDDEATPLSIEALLLELSALLCREGGPANPRWVGLARDAIDARFREPLSLGALAADLGAEPAELVRGFRRTYGVTPGEYLRRRRIEWADRQLREGLLSIDRIAFESGFHDRSHFVRVFTRVLGRRPVRVQEVVP